MKSTTTPLSLLNRVFGYPSFRGRQEDIIHHVLKGGSGLVLMPTGGGKSLCFQIPAMLRPGLGLVISPLIALMQDQVDALVQNGVAAAFYNSTLDGRKKTKSADRPSRANWICFTSPPKPSTAPASGILSKTSP